ncbi:MAG: thioesterase family protein [Schwartzia sp.]|nr:thioesterase family protein [Schwartzia sp. (in: firmicutes)]
MDAAEYIKEGMEKAALSEVTQENTARSMGSGSLDVYATPAMTALMEQAAAELAQEKLPEGWTSVGIALSIEHTSATPIGVLTRAVAKVTAVEGRKISYEIKAFDEAGEIGHGTHERFAVESEKFMAKAQNKATH